MTVYDLERSKRTLAEKIVFQSAPGWKPWELIARNTSPTPSLFVVQKPPTYSQRNMAKFGETRGGVGKSGVLEHKSGNISETRKGGGKVTMDRGPIGTHQRSFERYHPRPLRPPLPQNWGFATHTPNANRYYIRNV